MRILKTPTPEDIANGVREINLAHLRKPRTAVYVVLSESQASEYRILLELIFGLAAIEMQASTQKDATPVLMALDEAGNVSPPKLQDKLKIGRFRNTPYLLGFQDVSQIKNRFQENGGKAVLAGMKNQIFLPGIDPDTGAYASSMLGPTTVLSRTEVDAEGNQYDAERVTESRRDLRQAPELRRMVKYRQGIAIIDTADPILFRFLPRADTGDVTVPAERKIVPPPSLAEATAAMKAHTDSEKEQPQATTEVTQVGTDERATKKVLTKTPSSRMPLSIDCLELELPFAEAD